MDDFRRGGRLLLYLYNEDVSRNNNFDWIKRFDHFGENEKQTRIIFHMA